MEGLIESWLLIGLYVLVMPISMAYHSKFKTGFNGDFVGMAVFAAILWPLVTTFHVIYKLALFSLNKLF